MKEAIFVDPKAQADFERDGYLKLKLFDEAVMSKLKTLWSEYFPEDTDAFFSSSYMSDYMIKKEMSDKIVEIASYAINAHFTNYRSIGAAFLIKGIGSSGEMPMHQDWTIVDESQYYAVNMWVPLIDTTEENGTIEVMKGSHNWIPALRAPTLPFPFEGQQERIRKSLTAIEATLGDVVVLNQAVVHYSKANMSSEMRPAITMGIISEKAPLIFHYWNKEEEGKVEMFEQEDDFLLRFKDFHQDIFQRPKNVKSKGLISYDIPTVSSEFLDQFLPAEVVLEEKQGFFSRIFKR